MICALIPQSTILSQAHMIQYVSLAVVIVAIIVAILIGEVCLPILQVLSREL